MANIRNIECIESADLCHKGSLYADSISRRYYAMLFLLKELVRAAGFEPEFKNGSSHDNLIFHATELIKHPSEKGKFLNDCRTFKGLRKIADYEIKSQNIDNSNKSKILYQNIERIIIKNETNK
jgi:uncharacterized protein (UPF0332 family)